MLLLLLVWAFLVTQLDLGWNPNDDGALAHAADRVLSGQVPHVDFDEPYTGGLSFLNAAVLTLSGDRLLALRYPFAALTAAWMLLLWALARRVLGDFGAALVVGAATVGSVFMYMSPMPTWYNLMLGTGALYAIVRYDESGQRTWLFWSGLIVGLSFLVKSNGLVMGMAIGLILAVRAVRTGDRKQVVWSRALMLSSLAVTSALLVTAPSPTRIGLLLVPLALLVMAEWRAPQAQRDSNPRSLPGEVLVLGLGMALPIAGFFLGYWAIGGAEELWRALVVLPRVYVDGLGIDVPGFRFALVTAGLGVIVWRASKWRGHRLWVPILASVPLIWLLYVRWPAVVLLTAYTSLIWLSLAVALVYLQERRRDAAVSMPTVVVVVGGVVFQLVRFPTSNLYYTIQGLPLLAVGLVMLLWPYRTAIARAALAGLILVSAVFFAGKLEGRFFVPDRLGQATRYVPLEMPRGGLRVPETDAYFNDLVAAIRGRAEAGSVVLAGPDSPEIYYLAEVVNPTPILFDFLSAYRAEPNSSVDYASVLRPDVFVLNRDPVNSPAPDFGQLPDTCTYAGSHGPRDLYVDC